jgi:hypothetical protein
MQVTKRRTPNPPSQGYGRGRLFARSFGCGNDLVEALITAQIIPAPIEAEIAVCRPKIA